MWSYSICVTASNFDQDENMAKIDHIYNVAVQYIDNNEDGKADDELMEAYCAEHRCTFLITDESENEHGAQVWSYYSTWLYEDTEGILY